MSKRSNSPELLKQYSSLSKKSRNGVYPIEEVVSFLIELDVINNYIDDNLKILDILISNCNNVNEIVLIDYRKGLYYDEKYNKYSVKEGGVAATLAHYAAISGRADILDLLKKNKVDLHTIVLGTMNKPITPYQIAQINGHADTFNPKNNNRTSTGRTRGGACIIM